MSAAISPTADTQPAPPPEDTSVVFAHGVRKSLLDLSRRLWNLGLEGWASTVALAAKHGRWPAIVEAMRVLLDRTQLAQVIEAARGSEWLALEIGAMRSLAEQIQSSADTLAQMGVDDIGERSAGAAQQATGGAGT